MTSQLSSGGATRVRGRWVVAALITLGVAASLISASYWRFYNRELTTVQAELVDSLATWNRAQAQLELEDLQQRTQAAIRDKRAEYVLTDVRAFTRKYPRYEEAYTLMGQVYLGMEDLQQAYAQFKLSLKLDASQAQVHLLAGTICVKLHSLEQAEHHYLQAVGLDPQNRAYRLHLMQCYIDQQRYDEAMAGLVAVLAYDSSSHRAYAMQADLYLRHNKLDMALNQIIKAIEITPITQRDDQVVYLRRKAQVLRRQFKADHALQTLDQLSAQEKRDPLAMSNIALCWSMQGKLDEAARLYERALVDDPTNWRLAAGAATWWIKAANPSKAQRAINVVRAIDPRLPVIGKLEAQLSRLIAVE